MLSVDVGAYTPSATRISDASFARAVSMSSTLYTVTTRALGGEGGGGGGGDGGGDGGDGGAGGDGGGGDGGGEEAAAGGAPRTPQSARSVPNAAARRRRLRAAVVAKSVGGVLRGAGARVVAGLHRHRRDGSGEEQEGGGKRNMKPMRR